MLNQIDRYTLAVYQAIASLFDSESESYEYELEDVDFTDFFTGMIIANLMFYKRITDSEDIDLIDFISVCNRLVFQHVKGKKD